MQQFHKYICGNTFVIYMYNDLLTYILTSVKWDTTGHHWVASLEYYNVIMSCWSLKINVDSDALSHILREEHDQHIEPDAVCALMSHVAQGTTLIGAYSCNIQITETLDKQKHSKTM